MRGRQNLKGVVCLCLCAALSASSFLGTEVTAYGGTKKSFLVTQARSMALSGSSDYKKKYNEILLKQIKYQDAVRSARESGET